MNLASSLDFIVRSRLGTLQAVISWPWDSMTIINTYSKNTSYTVTFSPFLTFHDHSGSNSVHLVFMITLKFLNNCIISCCFDGLLIIPLLENINCSNIMQWVYSESPLKDKIGRLFWWCILLWHRFLLVTFGMWITCYFQEMLELCIDHIHICAGLFNRAGKLNTSGLLYTPG